MTYTVQDFCCVCGSKENPMNLTNNPAPVRDEYASVIGTGNDRQVVYSSCCDFCYRSIVRPFAKNFGIHGISRVRKNVFYNMTYEQLKGMVEFLPIKD